MYTTAEGVKIGHLSGSHSTASYEKDTLEKLYSSLRIGDPGDHNSPVIDILITYDWPKGITGNSPAWKAKMSTAISTTDTSATPGTSEAPDSDSSNNVDELHGCEPMVEAINKIRPRYFFFTHHLC